MSKKPRKVHDMSARNYRIVAAHMREIAYCMDSRLQGFFSLKTGKYVPVNRNTFEIVRGTKQRWVYTNYVVLRINGVTYVKGDPTYQRVNPLTMDEHIKASKMEMKLLVEAQNKNHVVNTFTVIAFPDSMEPSERTLNNIIEILNTAEPIEDE